MASAQIYRVSEKASIAVTFTSTSHSTAGLTVKAYLVTLAGIATEVGSTSGAAAGTSIAINFDFATSGISAGNTYKAEVIADPSGTNPIVMWPNADTADRIYFKVEDRGGIS